MPELPSGTVTFLFSDVEGSTRLLEEFPEAQRSALIRHGELLRGAISAHDGFVFETIGDGYYAVFTRPGDAVAAALKAQLDLQAESWGEIGQLRVRMALHSGAVESQGQRYYGAPLYRCARLLALAHGGQVLLSAATAQLVRGLLPADATLRGLGTHRLKDLAAPEEVFQLIHPGLADDFGPLHSIETIPTNLPIQLTSFVGRDHEMTELMELLRTNRILTLTGAGGVGKTRLAMQTAADLVDRYPDGVWLAELAPLSDPALVAHEVASSLGVHEQQGRPLTQTLVDYLRSKEALLVLDNCEHLLEASAQLVDALARSCPGVQVLATSREALGVAGEVDWRVPSLSLPDPGGETAADRLLECESVRLFVDRARAAVPSFRLTDDHAVAVADVCCRLDGIPLAIELAAARVKVLSAEQIASRLDNVFALLTGGNRLALPRQQTLQAMVDWSYDLLSEPERRLFNRLSVFAGGWTLEAAESICGGDGVFDVFDLLARLVEKSLALAEDHGTEIRYRLLEPMRQYAAEKLRASGEDTRLQDRHLEWFVAFAEQAEPHLDGADAGTWMGRMETDLDNIRGALRWSSREGESGEAALRIAAALFYFWYLELPPREGRAWLENGLKNSPIAPRVRMRALSAASFLTAYLGDPPAAEPLAQEALAIARELDDRWAIPWLLHLLGRIEYLQWNAVGARRFGNESLAAARDHGDPGLRAHALHLLGLAEHIDGHFREARAAYAESYLIRQEIGSIWTGIVLQLMALAAHNLGDHAQAREELLRSMEYFEELPHGGLNGQPLAQFSAMAAANEQYERAVRLAAFSIALSDVVGMLPIPLVQKALDEGLERSRQALTLEIYNAAWAEGSVMSRAQAMAEARAVEVTPVLPGGEQSPDPDHSLSPREVEVLRLLAGGATNNEIAAALVLSIPTVERHITHIYQKIGARRRADATAYALKAGLA